MSFTNQALLGFRFKIFKFENGLKINRTFQLMAKGFILLGFKIPHDG